MADQDADVPVVEDNSHLQGVPPLFASQVDLWLSAKDPSNHYNFPVHKQIVSAHSTILCQALQDLQSVGTKRKRHETLEVLPLVDDDPIAVRAVLKTIYSSFNTSQKADGQTLATSEIDRELAPRFMFLAHKYSMTSVLLMHQQALMKLLRQLPQHAVRKSDIALVLQCASAAEACNAPALLDWSEHCIALHFSAFAAPQHAMATKLSSASLVRIAEVIIKYQASQTDAMRLAWKSRLTAGQSTLASVDRFIASEVEFAAGNPRCPECAGPLHIDKFRLCKVQHMQPNNKCRWPQVTFTSPAPPLPIAGVPCEVADVHAKRVSKVIADVLS